ncbi:hypothetical protein GW17_00026837 [Ensete ventricosum]|nr:hypothetical protein GW17_00026837 [Ensete ventricosum]
MTAAVLSSALSLIQNLVTRPRSESPHPTMQQQFTMIWTSSTKACFKSNTWLRTWRRRWRRTARTIPCGIGSGSSEERLPMPRT